MKLKILLFSIITYFFILCSSESQIPLEDKLQKVLDKEISKYNVNGVSAAVIFSDGKIWNGVSGISHDTVTIKPEMLFAIGSITKNFIAALTLKLVEEEALSLDDPLSNWLPNYTFVDNNITIRQLLNHTSGLYMFWDNQDIWDDLRKDRTKNWSPEQVLKYIKEPYFKAGNGWRYSNTNYLLLAMIINKVTGSNLSMELEKYFQPLGISNFYVSQEEKLPQNLAHVYGDNFQPGSLIRDITFVPRTSHESITYGSSGIFTTAKDLALWSQNLFGGKILNTNSMNEMLTFIKFRSVANMRAYGLGVQEYTRQFSWGKRAIGHGGGNIGTTTYMVYLPDYQISIVVMINAFPNKCADTITRGIIKSILKDLNSFSLSSYLLPYFDDYRFRYIALFAVAIWLIMIINYIRKRRKSLK